MSVRTRLAAFAAVLLAAVGAGVAIGARTARHDTPAVTTVTAPAAPHVPATTSTPAPIASIDARGLRRAVAALSASGALGVFVRPLGDAAPVAAGPLQDGPAWSTIKPAIVLARYTLPGAAGDPRVASLATAALTASDNAAAQALFDDVAAQAGGVVAGSLAVEQELRAGGDATTHVNAVVTRPEFSSYGQTRWSLAAGTRFYGALARGCVAPTDADARVSALLRTVVPEQRWGLGASAPPSGTTVAFKGGWGPDPDGRYLVRQFGVVARGDGSGVAIGLIARPVDGSFASGTQLLDRLAAVVVAHVRWRQLSPAGTC